MMMNPISCFGIFVCLFIVCSAESKPTALFSTLFGQKCEKDEDCALNECCTKMFAAGKRCRGLLTEGSICATFTEIVIRRIHRRCKCESGTECSTTATIFGIYKINKCTRI